MATLRKLWAFVKRDFLQEASYRLNFVVSLIGILFSCLTFYFLDRFIQGHDIATLEPYGGANTGIGGVIRDTLGTGLGAKPVSLCV